MCARARMRVCVRVLRALRCVRACMRACVCLCGYMHDRIYVESEECIYICDRNTLGYTILKCLFVDLCIDLCIDSCLASI